jgi:hypothetical protein
MKINGEKETNTAERRTRKKCKIKLAGTTEKGKTNRRAGICTDFKE